MQCSQSYYFPSFRSRYSPQLPVLRHSQSIIFTLGLVLGEQTYKTMCKIVFLVRFELFIMVRMTMLFWLLLPLRLLGGTNILKKHAVFIFSPEDGDIMFL
jgi:hypothetical protein